MDEVRQLALDHAIDVSRGSLCDPEAILAIAKKFEAYLAPHRLIEAAE